MLRILERGGASTPASLPHGDSVVSLRHAPEYIKETFQVKGLYDVFLGAAGRWAIGIQNVADGKPGHAKVFKYLY